MITLKNEFHDTETRVRAQIGDTLTENQVRRAARNLCGLYDCDCGGEAGQRGSQHTDDGRRFVLLEERQGLLTLKYVDHNCGSETHVEGLVRRNHAQADDPTADVRP